MEEEEEAKLLSCLGAVTVDSETLTRQLLAEVEERINNQSTATSSCPALPSTCQESTNPVVSSPFFGKTEVSSEIVKDEIMPKENRGASQAPLPQVTSSILHSILTTLVKKEEAEAATSAIQPRPHQDGFLELEEETETERRIRTGEMTPFGNCVTESNLQISDTAGGSTGVLNVSSYLQTQMALQEQFRTNQRKNRAAKQNKRKRPISEDDGSSSDEDDGRAGVRSSKLKSKDPIRMNLLFPKQRAKKTKLGTRSSKNKANMAKSHGLLPSEEMSMYISGDDSDFIPREESESDSEPQNPRRSKANTQHRSMRVKKKNVTHAVSESSEDSLEYLSEDEGRAKRTRKVGEYTDDGNLKFYQARVQKWKETETRFTSDVHKMEGGFKLPKFIWDALYKYQKVGVKWLWELHQQRSGGILSDEMGLGKTIQVICFLAGVSCANVLFRFSEFRGVGPSMIVCPATVMNQWVQEFHKWWPPFRIGLLHDSGTYTGRKDGFIRSIHDSRGFLITTYQGVVRNQEELLKYSWDYLILDEGHKIRNPDAHVTVALKRIPTPRRIILSGSPLQNNLKELWSLFDFVTPGRLGTLPTFLERFAVPITQGGYSNASDLQVATAYKCATTLRDIINPYLLRRMKSDVRDHLVLPPKNEQVLFCKVTEEQKTVYQAYLKSDQIRNVIKGEHNLFVSLINLRKICNHPHLFDGGPNRNYGNGGQKNRNGNRRSSTEILEEEDEEGEDLQIDPSDSFGHWHFSGKMVVVRTLLRVWQKQEQKVLLFTQSRQMLCILEKFLQQENYSYLRLDGGTSIGSRQTVIDKFNKDPSVFIFLLTTRVGGLGVNLTGANRVIIFDPDWNPSTDLQARERAWRIGQGREVTIYRLITSGTIEEKIYHRQIFKQFLTNRVLKDPRQKRFFKQNELFELFTFNDGKEGGTETEMIFEGTDSTVPRPRKRGGRSVGTSAVEEPRENSRGKFRGVPNLVKQKPFETTQDSDQSELAPMAVKERETRTLTQDEYVLRKLFKKSVVDVALKHDRIVDTDQPDHAIIEKEAAMVARDAIRVLKKSREQCWEPETGRISWTGTHGSIRRPKKSATTSTVSTFPKNVPLPTPTEPVVDESVSFFSQPRLLVEDNKEPTSGADLLAIIRARKRRELQDSEPSGVEGSNNDQGTTMVEVEASKMELLADIRSFVAFRGTTDGEVTTAELVAEFGSKLPTGDSPVFKHMLNQLCTSRQVQGRRVWRLKPEFR